MPVAQLLDIVLAQEKWVVEPEGVLDDPE